MEDARFVFGNFHFWYCVLPALQNRNLKTQFYYITDELHKTLRNIEGIHGIVVSFVSFASRHNLSGLRSLRNISQFLKRNFRFSSYEAHEGQTLVLNRFVKIHNMKSVKESISIYLNIIRTLQITFG
jgi:hypothetical protein